MSSKINDGLFVCPKVIIGQVVQWRHSPGSETLPAIVTACYDRCIDCSVVVKDSKVLIPKTGVRHVNDPVWPGLTSDAQSDGVFEVSERDQKIDSLLGDFIHGA